MLQRRSGRTETDDESRVDHLLNLLSDLSQRDPSPHVRERLEAFAAQRLRDAARGRSAGWRQLAWLRLTLAFVLVAAIGLAAAVVFHFREHEAVQPDRTAKENGPGVSPAVSQVNATHIAPAAPASITTRPRIQHPHSALAQIASARRMIMQLPYSNNAIETGTYSTIRVSMSQSELLSLGFPINATVSDRRIAAELTLGDDGLPRAISLPLPLEVMKEKR
jgi:hypothetical protein